MVDCLRYCKEFEFGVNIIPLLKFLSGDVSVSERVYRKIIIIEDSDEVRCRYLYESHPIWQINHADQSWLALFLLDSCIAVKQHATYGLHEHEFLYMRKEVLLMLSLTLRIGLLMFKDQ